LSPSLESRLSASRVFRDPRRIVIAPGVVMLSHSLHHHLKRRNAVRKRLVSYRSGLEILAPMLAASSFPPARGRKGAAHAYNISSYREQERRFVEQAEAAYTRFVAGWNPRGPKPAAKARTGAAR
jgi:hypothetical protein